MGRSRKKGSKKKAAPKPEAPKDESYVTYGATKDEAKTEEPVKVEEAKPAVEEAKAEEPKGTVVPQVGLPGTNFERTFIAIKPDGVQRGKVGKIIERFEDKGFKLVAMKMMVPSKEKAEGHYADLKSKPFFGGLVNFFSSGPIVAMVWEGVNAIAAGRMLLGATNPKDSLPGTIRGDLCVDIGRNICHGSDGPDSAAHEISFWFDESEIAPYTSAENMWVYEKGAEVAC